MLAVVPGGADRYRTDIGEQWGQGSDGSAASCENAETIWQNKQRLAG